MAKAKFSPAYEWLRRSLIDARQTAGLNQADIARRLGRPQSYVSKIESGERRLDVVEFVELSSAIGTDAIRILRGVIRVRNK